MKKGQLHLNNIRNGRSKILNEKNSVETFKTEKAWERSSNDTGIKNISAVATDCNGWMLVADPKESNLICLDNEGNVKGKCIMRDGRTDIDLTNVGELKYNTKTNVLVMIKNSGKTSQIGAFVLKYPNNAIKKEEDHEFREFLPKRNDPKNNYRKDRK